MKNNRADRLNPILHKHDDGCSCGHDHHEAHSHDEHGNYEHHPLEAHSHDEDSSCGQHHLEEHNSVRKHNHKDLSGGGITKTYILENLGCAHCASKMESQIASLEGVGSATITYATKQLRITAADPTKYLDKIHNICTAIEANVKVMDPDTKEAIEEKKHYDLPIILTGALLFITGEIMENIGVTEIPCLAIFIVAYVILGGEILLTAIRNISKGQIFDENFLMSIATLGAFAIRQYPEAVGVMLFYRIGEYFEHKAVERSRDQIMGAVDMRPEVVYQVHGDHTHEIPAEKAAVGDIILVRPGDRIPLDGVIVEGFSRIDTSPVTGEPVPASVSVNDSVLSGCVNTSGQLKLQIEKPLSESMVSRILDSVENAAASKPKIDRFITRFSKIYTPCVVALALATATIPSIFTGNWSYWIYTALTFLVISCPCALVLSVPLAYFSGIGSGSKRGILFKGGVAIEALGNLHAVIMDKTGTITEGNFNLQKIVSTGEYSEKDILRICANCEQNSTHPIAHSIVTAAREEKLTFEKLISMEEIAGYGIIAEMTEGKVLCGNRKLMEKNQIDTTAIAAENYGSEIYVAINGKLAGYLIIADTIKADAASAISKLKALGLHTVMLTGDAQDSANAIASQAGIDEVHAKLLPEDKLTILQKVRNQRGSVMFVGDGINDAPVLAGADVGAAMGSGADAAIEAADTVFMNSSMESIPSSISIARSTNRIAMQNVVFALIIKIAVMILGLLGFANMWMAVFADTGVAMLCVLNAVRILYKK